MGELMNHLADPVPNWLFRLVTLAVTMGTLSACGCGGSSPFRRNSVEKQVENDPNYSIAGIQGPNERRLNTALWNRKRDEILADPDSEMAQSLAAYEAARKLYDQEQYVDAEKAFKKLAKERRDKYESFGAKFRRFWGVTDKAEYDPYSNFGDPLEEDALYMLAQTQFAQKKYAAAQNSYEELLKHYPSTRHLDPVTRQLFRIARYWLDFPENVGDKGDVQLANAESKEASADHNQPSPLSRVPVFPNLTDKTRPTFDTHGRGLQALRSIWLHDATGPLADDALMLAANHHLRTANYIEAARLYSLLRDQYPDSPHFKDAFLLGSHVTLATYQGPAYDGKSLEEARELKQTMLQIFPELSPEDRARLQDEVAKMREAEVARLWELVDYYRIKGSDPSVALHCHLIINKHPDSQYAEMAREMLRKLDEKSRRNESLLGRFGGQPSPNRDAAQPSGPTNGTESSSGTVTLPGQSAPAESTDKPGNRGGWFGMLRRAEQPPQLQPIESQPLDLEAQSPGRATLSP